MDMESMEECQAWLQEGLGVSFLKEGHKWDTEEDVANVVQRINECPNLKYLELEGNTLGVSASKAIGKALESKRELEAALWKDLFTGRLKTEIPQSFNFLFAGVDLAGACLQRLDLSDNAIGPVGMVDLGPFFKSRSSFSLKELILNNNGFGPEGGSSLAEALLECLNLSKEVGGTVFQLKVFACGRNRLEDKAAKRLAEFFKKVQTLEEVHMPQNGIYKEGIAALSEGLRCNGNLRILNLNDNTIRGEGIDVLANAIAELKALQELSLADCLLKGPGVMKVVNALKEGVNVRKVNFSGNELSKASGKQAAEALRGLPNLEEVNLSCNSLGTEGGEFISRILHQINVIIEEDEGTQEEDEGSEDDAAAPEDLCNGYANVSDLEEETGSVNVSENSHDTFTVSFTNDGVTMSTLNEKVNALEERLEQFIKTINKLDSEVKNLQLTISELKAKCTCHDEYEDEIVQGVIPLPPLHGEADADASENVICEYTARLYRFFVETKEWNEHGKGIIKLLQSKTESTVVRVAMWQQGSGRLMCNFRLHQNFKIDKKQNESKVLCWTCQDFSNTPTLKTFSLRFQKEQECSEFKNAVENLSKSITPVVTKDFDFEAEAYIFIFPGKDEEEKPKMEGMGTIKIYYDLINKRPKLVITVEDKYIWNNVVQASNLVECSGALQYEWTGTGSPFSRMKFKIRALFMLDKTGKLFLNVMQKAVEFANNLE